MKQIDLNTLEELEDDVAKLYALLKAKRTSSYSTISSPLFRGQESASWNLLTTLERYKNQVISVELYNRYLWSIKSAIEAFTQNKWNVEQNQKIDETFSKGPPNYDFMAYVRHHGFPSPLLDWSQSLYIALFFAYQKASVTDRVAVYIYVELLGEGKGGTLYGPRICELGPNISTHKRHFMQQGQYTVCVEKTDDYWVYCSHEKYFSAATHEDQDYLMKLTLPGDIKYQVLNRLQSMNINAFTLYGSEDSLMDMLAFKEIMKKKY